MVGQKSFFEPFGNTRWSLPRLAISITIPIAVGAIGSIFTADSVETWYQMIEKPWFTPPNWLFGPAWTVLYVMMGISLYLVWRKTTIDRSKHGTRPSMFAVFGIQLGLNALWSFLFFGLRSPQLAFAEIVILLASIMVTIIIFQKNINTGINPFVAICWLGRIRICSQPRSMASKFLINTANQPIFEEDG